MIEPDSGEAVRLVDVAVELPGGNAYLLGWLAHHLDGGNSFTIEDLRAAVAGAQVPW